MPQKTALQELIDKWETEKGSYIPNAPIYSAFIEEAKTFLEKEKNQLIAFGYSQIQQIDSELGDLIYKKVPEEIYNETFVPLL
jgi:spore coat polysaccharide biosynthesis predicted glycosyltransferase SpsG